MDINGQIKVALLTSMVPGDLQDHIFQCTDAKATYESTRNRVLSLAQDRLPMARPTPMEVDRVGNEGWQREEDWQEEDEVEVDYVRGCRNCHFLTA